MRNDMIPNDQAENPKPGLSAAVPDVQFIGGGGLSPDSFARTDPLSSGHQRRSPGDGQQGAALSFYTDLSGKEAEVGEATLGPGILPTPLASNPTPHPIRAADFARGDIGTANSSGVVRRAPLGPEDPLFSGGRDLGDMLQSDGQPSAMEGKPFPDTAGRSGTGDDNGLLVLRPTIDDSPSIGGDYRILKDGGRVVGGRMDVGPVPGKAAPPVDPGFGHVTAIRPQSSRIARAVKRYFGEVNGRPIEV
jgi:hypothetical protein